MYPYIWRTPDYLQPPVIALSSAASQLWFIERAWRLTGSRFLFGLVAILIIALEIGAAFALLPIGVLYGRDPAYFCTVRFLLDLLRAFRDLAHSFSSSARNTSRRAKLGFRSGRPHRHHNASRQGPRTSRRAALVSFSAFSASLVSEQHLTVASL